MTPLAKVVVYSGPMIRAFVMALALVGCTTPVTLAPTPSPSGTTAPTAPTPSASATARPTPPPQIATEDAAWAAIRTAVPTAPLIRPAWLPNYVDRRTVAYAIDGASYRVTYNVNGGDRMAVRFGLGPLPPLGPAPVSAIGIRVRGVPAAFEFPSNDFSRTRIVWRESTAELAIEGGEIRGDDLLQTAWALAPGATPAPRTRVGSCAPDRAEPDQVVRRLFELATSGDADAVADCWSRDRVAENLGMFAIWSKLGPTSDLEIRYGPRVATRYWVSVTFTFARDPSAFQGPRKLLFCQVGVEEGRWRIFESATAIVLPPPPGLRSRVLPVTAAFAAARSEASGLPALSPSSLPAGLVGEIGPEGRTGSVVLLRDDLRDITIRLGVCVCNLSKISARGTQAELAFRSDPTAFYQIHDAAEPTGHRALRWTEPNTKNCDRCEYVLSSTGLDEATFWAIARSLR